jgi:hypothetical protein
MAYMFLLTGHSTRGFPRFPPVYTADAGIDNKAVYDYSSNLKRLVETPHIENICQIELSTQKIGNCIVFALQIV